MDSGQLVLVLAPMVLGLVALVLGLRMLRPERGESGTTRERTLGGVLLLFFTAGCVLTSFALWICVGLFSGPRH